MGQKAYSSGPNGLFPSPDDRAIVEGVLSRCGGAEVGVEGQPKRRLRAGAFALTALLIGLAGTSASAFAAGPKPDPPPVKRAPPPPPPRPAPPPPPTYVQPQPPPPALYRAPPSGPTAAQILAARRAAAQAKAARQAKAQRLKKLKRERRAARLAAAARVTKARRGSAPDLCDLRFADTPWRWHLRPQLHQPRCADRCDHDALGGARGRSRARLQVADVRRARGAPRSLCVRRRTWSYSASRSSPR